ncbi:putative NAD(P)/FAD-binding protein YdhS [Rhizobium sp. BK650]|uniref:FAD/NAD(P)-binding protein n=1 Tax=Rhizobium sp. BK650 TaxID=2586990 RepID=UPI00161CC9C8|nr:FAD/NAD(P)-binding protein [Rhizobium sp. BK650]MBB3657809.1 putative NAD(P)/FAD-binding protein YdhS [Rhizobium sp. BK650]
MIYDVVVVGSGFSAIAVVCNLVRKLPQTASVAVIGDDPGFGRGTAYRTEMHLHRLNVPAARMSLFMDRPADFIEWLSRKDRPSRDADFASRSDYGLYVRDTLANLLRRNNERCRVDFIKAKAAGCVERYSGTLGFLLEHGGEIAGRHVVLCLGLGNAKLPVDIEGLGATMRSHVIENPWRLSWLTRVGPLDRVCILGSGLTMIDQVLALRSHGHRGRIDVLSRRGLVPHGHARDPKPPAAIEIDARGITLSRMLHGFRQQIRSGTNWRSLMDALRPKTQVLWQDLAPSERSRFLRHALPWWNIHRHRLAPAIHDEFDKLRQQGVVNFHSGYLKTLSDAGDEFCIEYRRRGSQETIALSVDWIVNCTGMERAGLVHSPLLQEMRRQGLVVADPLGLGISVDRASRTLNSTGTVQSNLYAVGALTAGQFWEITAVPDIRAQAEQVAAQIAM